MVLEILRRTGAQLKGMGHLMANIYCWFRTQSCTFPTLQTRLKMAVAFLKVSLGEFICFDFYKILGLLRCLSLRTQLSHVIRKHFGFYDPSRPLHILR